jgi:hypothetical protein
MLLYQKTSFFESKLLPKKFHVIVNTLKIDCNTKLAAKTIFIQAFNHEDISIDVCIESCPAFKIIQSRQDGPKV